MAECWLQMEPGSPVVVAGWDLAVATAGVQLMVLDSACRRAQTQQEGCG